MKRSTKAVLLSALVLPGLGHIYLKKYLLGAVLALAAAISVYVTTSIAVHSALDVVQQIETGKVGTDVSAITESLHQQSQDAGQTMSRTTNLFVLLWVVGMVDAYRVAHKQEQARRPSKDVAGGH